MIMHPAQDAVGFVLAGGLSSRMGRDKALLMLDGRPLVENALSILRQAGLPASISGARTPLASCAPVVPDTKPGLGPLGGVCAALASMPSQHAAFLPVDLPLLPASLLLFLLHHARMTGRAVTVAAVNGDAQTFPVVLKRTALPALKDELDAGRAGCFSAFQTAAASLGEPLSVVPVELLAQVGQVDHPAAIPVAHWFLNVNTPPDLRRASALRRAPIA